MFGGGGLEGKAGGWASGESFCSFFFLFFFLGGGGGGGPLSAGKKIGTNALIVLFLSYLGYSEMRRDRNSMVQGAIFQKNFRGLNRHVWAMLQVQESPRTLSVHS